MYPRIFQASQNSVLHIYSLAALFRILSKEPGTWLWMRLLPKHPGLLENPHWITTPRSHGYEKVKCVSQYWGEGQIPIPQLKWDAFRVTHGDSEAKRCVLNHQNLFMKLHSRLPIQAWSTCTLVSFLEPNCQQPILTREHPETPWCPELPSRHQTGNSQHRRNTSLPGWWKMQFQRHVLSWKSFWKEDILTCTWLSFLSP